MIRMVWRRMRRDEATTPSEKRGNMRWKAPQEADDTLLAEMATLLDGRVKDLAHVMSLFMYCEL